MSLKAVSLSEQIAQHLAERIISGDLAPGARLPEMELAKELDVSTNSLREAFRLLEKQYLIELQPRRGAKVCDITETQVHDLYDFLFLLLSTLAADAARNWLPGQIEDLANMLPALQQHYQNDDLPSAHQLAFQLVETASHRFARNSYMADGIADLMPLLKRYSFIALQEETTEFDVSLQIFQQLIVHVLGRNDQAAADDIRAYGRNQCQVVLRAIAKRNAA